MNEKVHAIGSMVVVLFVLAASLGAGETRLLHPQPWTVDGYPYNAHWATDAAGRQVAFGSARDPVTGVDVGESLWIYDVDAARFQRTPIPYGSGPSRFAPRYISMSGDARFVVFAAEAARYVAGASGDGLVWHDRGTGAFRLVSANAIASGHALSDDGRRIVFARQIRDSATDQTYLAFFVRDLASDTTTEIGRHHLGRSTIDLFAALPVISADGSTVAFATDTTLMPGDESLWADVYIYDVGARQLGIATQTETGGEIERSASHPRLSANGRYLAFASDQFSDGGEGGGIHLKDRLLGGIRTIDGAIDDLWFGHTLELDRLGRFISFDSTIRGSNAIQVYRWDRNLDAVVRASVDASGADFPQGATSPILSGDGSRVFFVGASGDGSYPSSGTWMASFADGTTTPHARIDFKPAWTTTQPGYSSDSGAVYGARDGGLEYGWSSENATGRDRNSPASPDQRHDTLLHVAGHMWEIALPSGLYDIQIALGDATYPDSVVDLSLEGRTFALGRLNSHRRWISLHRRVAVTDGRLTLGQGPTARALKVCFLDIHRVTGVDAAFAARVNFQPMSSPVPLGFVSDHGSPFGDRGNGLLYGWNLANYTARDRGMSPDDRYDTLIHTQKASNPDAVWEIAVPAGPYEIRAVAGDSAYADSVHDLLIEGTQAFSGTSQQGDFHDETVGIEVLDGRVTLRNGPGAANAKLNFVELVRVPTGPG
ncbi:MAG TPA: hypothetical protein VEL07_08970 [Planctomycetota bacterium]|nr:hypothetical protein [Planctomycetota bacterium]